MSEHLETNSITMSAPDKAKELKLCINLIDRIIKDEYADVGLNKVEEKYGKLMWVSKPTDNPKFVTREIYRTKTPVGTPEYYAERLESSKVYKHAERQRKQDIDYLFDIMKKRIQGWWD